MADASPGAWTTSRLAEALSAPAYADQFTIERIEQAEPVLAVTMREHGDLRIFLSCAGDQIVVSTLL